MLRMKRKPLVKLREWGKKNKLDRNTMRNTKPISEPISPLEEEAMTFPPPANEPPSPTYIPAFSPLEEEEEDEVKEAITTHTTMEVKRINITASRVLTNHNTNVTRARFASPIGREGALS